MTTQRIAAVDDCRHDYQVPTLIEIGEASDLVLGIVGGGFDGDFGMTEAQFEFEADADPI